METKREVIKFESFIKLSEVSAQRSRGLISVLMVSTFVSLLALYNSLPVDQNWLYSRLRSLQAAEQWMEFQTSTKVDSVFYLDNSVIMKGRNSFDIRDIIRISGIINNFGFDTCDLPEEFSIPHKQISMCFPEYCIVNDTLNIGLIDYLQLSRALHYLSGEKVVSSSDELKRVVAYLNRSIIENSLSIKIPILGIAFDINSLAIISALAFSIIFFLLYFYLMRERKNLILLFELAEELEISKIKIYQLLSMNQVLTVPGSIDEFIIAKKNSQPIPPLEVQSRNFRLNKLMTLAPMLFACLIWLTIIGFDIKSMAIGTSYNASLTILNYVVAGFFGIIMFFFLFLTYTQWRELNNEWNVQRKKIRDILDSKDGKDYSDDDPRLD